MSAQEKDHATAEDTNGVLPEPLPLSRELDPPTHFPITALGDIGSAVAEQMHAIVQAPLALIGQSLLAAMNQVAQPYANVVIDGRVSPLSDFFLTLGESGERKSAVDGWALAPVRDRQRVLMERYREDLENFEQALLVHDAATKRILGDKKLSNSDKQKQLTQTDRPVSPVMPLFIVSEPSTEAIQRQLIIGLPSIGLVNDEGGQFLGGYAMSSEKRLATLTTLSRIWDRGEFDRVRVGDGSGSYYGRRLALHLMVQPAVAASLLADPLAREQGFLARCLVSYPASTAGQRRYSEQNLSATPAYTTYAERMRSLLEQRWPVNDNNELEPPSLSLNAEAKTAWVAFYNEIENSLGAESRYAPVRSLAAKAPEHVARLAATFAVFDGDPWIHSDHIDRAIYLLDHYLDEALRLWGSGHISADLKLAEETLTWLLEKVGTGRVVPLATLYRNGPTALRSASSARKVMQTLQQHGWVARTSHPTAREAFKVLGGR